MLVNALVMVHCCARTFSMSFASDMGEHDVDSVYHASMALSAYVNARFSALSRCLNSSLGPEEVKHRKTILRVVRHNIELCNKVAELVDLNIPLGFRYRTERCLSRIFDAVESTSAECEATVCNNESAKRRLDTAGKARTSFKYYFRIYSRCSKPQWNKQGEYTRALLHVIGSLFSIYRGYASTGNSDHVVAGKFEHCLRILLALHCIRGCITIYKVRKIYLDMCTVYDEIQECVTRGLLLNPQIEVGFCDAMLGYLSAMIGIWEKKYGRYFNNTRQTDVFLSQPSTSGLGSTRAGMGRAQAPYMPPQDQGTMPYLHAQPSTSYAQPPTSGLGSVVEEASITSCQQQTPDDDEHGQPSKRARYR
ncbi:HGE-14 family type IV secretion system effector [Anaplasma phagocytophilum]|uniref:HGE-14 family type IV secretion system effector n=1 Tax=Anaplasma phagocytophilum TaxID=948 RepID=UPI00397731A9